MWPPCYMLHSSARVSLSSVFVRGRDQASDVWKYQSKYHNNGGDRLGKMVGDGAKFSPYCRHMGANLSYVMSCSKAVIRRPIIEAISCVFGRPCGIVVARFAFCWLRAGINHHRWRRRAEKAGCFAIKLISRYSANCYMSSLSAGSVNGATAFGELRARGCCGSAYLIYHLCGSMAISSSRLSRVALKRRRLALRLARVNPAIGAVINLLLRMSSVSLYYINRRLRL